MSRFKKFVVCLREQKTLLQSVGLASFLDHGIGFEDPTISPHDCQVLCKLNEDPFRTFIENPMVALNTLIRQIEEQPKTCASTFRYILSGLRGPLTESVTAPPYESVRIGTKFAVVLHEGFLTEMEKPESRLLFSRWLMEAHALHTFELCPFLSRYYFLRRYL